MKYKYLLILVLWLIITVCGDMVVSNASQNQTEPSSAGLNHKSFVGWTDSRSGTSNLNIYGNIVDSSGSLIGADIPICVTPSSNQYDVATASGGAFIVAWIDEVSGNPEIHAVQVNEDGSLPYSEMTLTSNANSKDSPSADNIGNDVMIVWQESSTRKIIRGQRLTWSGSQYSATGSPFDISGSTYDAFDPDICGGSVDYLVVWSDTINWAVVGQRVSSTGSPVGSATNIATYAYPNNPQSVAAAWDGSQWFVVWNVYDGSSHNVFGRYVNSSGSPTGSILNIATEASPNNETRPDAAYDGIGFLVVWQGTPDIYGNIFGSRIIGTSVGADTTLSDGGTHNENYPCIDWNDSFHDVFWQDYRSGSTWDIYTNRFGQTPWNGPTAIAIRPPDMSGTTCGDQTAVMYLYDSDGINTSTIEFDANGTIVGIGDPRLSYSNDTLRFAPSSDWPSGTWLTMCLNHAEDMVGIDIIAPVCWDFMYDRVSPVWGTCNPADGDTVSGGAIPISIGVSDADCGMSTDSMGFQVMGIWYFYGTSPAVSWDGLEMQFDPAEEGLSFDPFDTFTVCATARDKAEYCGYNQIDTCWTFYTEGNRIYGNVDLSDVGDDSGALVEATVGDSLWSDITDVAGDYSIPCVQEVPGIQVRASKAGYSDSSVVIDMSSGGEIEVNFRLDPTLALYESDFEADDGDLNTVSFGYRPMDWEWGTPTDGPGSAHSGSKCWATILDGDYNNTSMSRLTLGPISIPEGSSPTLTWWQWYRFQNNSGGGFHDGGNIKIWSPDSTIVEPDKPYDGNQSEWNYLIPYQTSYADNDYGDYWHEVSIDLSPWEGEEITISWDFGSSNNNVESGWFIDDVVILTAPAIVLSFDLSDTIWNPVSEDPPDTLITDETEKIVLSNTGNVALDFAMCCDTVPYFTLIDSLCYGCLGLWAIFNDMATPPVAGDFDSEDFFTHNFRYADADTFGPGGFNIYPDIDSTENLWLRLDTPQYFPIDTFTVHVLIMARQHMD